MKSNITRETCKPCFDVVLRLCDVYNKTGGKDGLIKVGRIVVEGESREKDDETRQK